MKRLAVIVATISVAIPSFAQDNRPGQATRTERREARQDLDQLVRDINALARPGPARRAGLAEAANQAGVPLQRLQATQKQHPRLGVAGLFLAHEIAKNTRRTPDELIKTRAERSWAEIAQTERQDLAELQRKLTRLQDAMRNPGAEYSRATPGEPADPPLGDSPFERTIQSVNALGQEPDVERIGLGAIARETGLSRRDVEQASQRHQHIGLGDLLVAQELSLHTRQPINQLWDNYVNGQRTWAEIAQSHNANVNQIERKLGRVEDAMMGRMARTDDRDAARDRVRGRDDRDFRRSDDREARTDDPRNAGASMIEATIRSLNSLGQEAEARQAGLAALSRETATGLPQIQQLHREHQDLGLGDLAVAQEIAVRSRKSVRELREMNLGGKNWAEIAREHNVDVRELERKLRRVEQAMQDAQR